MVDIPRPSDRQDTREHTDVLHGLANVLTGQVAASPTINGAMTINGALTWTTDNTYDVGASGANRPRDLFLGRNATIGGTLGVTGALTPSGGFVLPWVSTGTFTVTQGAGAIATSTLIARYVLLGKLCILQVVAVMNGAGVALAAVNVNVPAAIQSRAVGMRLGVMEIEDASAGISYSGVCRAAGATAFAGVAHATAPYLGNTGFTAALAAGDVVSLACQYETL